MPAHVRAENLPEMDPRLSGREPVRPPGIRDVEPFSKGRRLDEAGSIAVCDAIIDLLSVFFNVSGRQLRSAGRTAQPVSRVRQIGMYVAHVTLGMKMGAVGAGFGRDKSTVVHACHTIEDLRDDDDFDLIVSRVERLVAIAFPNERATATDDE